jgi:hypothetical protein
MDESPIMGHRTQGKVFYQMINLDLKNVDESSKSGGVLTTFDAAVILTYNLNSRAESVINLIFSVRCSTGGTIHGDGNLQES